MTVLKTKTGKRGAALLIVLFIVMVITISSLGFLSRSDVELACGQNMALRIQMDYLAESGLEHAKGLILNPQDISSEYWTGATDQQLVAGNDYYDVAVVRDDSDPANRCNYIIDCNSYRLRNAEKIGRSNIRAELRLDPCVAFWSGNNTTVWSGFTINGDVYCNSILVNTGTIDGDVFANTLIGSISGKQKAVGDLSLAWPRVTVADFTSNYTTQTISSSSLSGQILGPYNPVRVCYRNGDLLLAGNVQIEGMLVVDGDLTVQGNVAGINTITAAKNLPAILVTGNLIIGDNGALEVNGLAVVDGAMQVSADAAGISILGGLFVNGGIVETTADSSGNDNTGTLYNGPTWQPSGGRTEGGLEFDGINDYVNVMDDVSLRPGNASWTISVWARPPNQNQRAFILSKRQNLSPYEQFSLGIAGSDSHASLSGKKVVFCYIESASVCERSGYTTNDIANGDWHHIGVVADKSTDTIRIYVDGVEEAITVDYNFGSWPTIDNVDNLHIGCIKNYYYFNGVIDDVRIYNQVLDANDVYPPSDGLPGLVGHWKLDESGSSITVTAAPAKTAIVVWSAVGIEEKWGQAAGAFFKSIQRQ
ncbi:MAG: LamG domain-containing protein [Planctomycetota bacterium]|jgi:cytoskeletal protein CcmA (bactofilin family)